MVTLCASEIDARLAFGLINKINFYGLFLWHRFDVGGSFFHLAKNKGPKCLVHTFE